MNISGNVSADIFGDWGFTSAGICLRIGARSDPAFWVEVNVTADQLAELVELRRAWLEGNGQNCPKSRQN